MTKKQAKKNLKRFGKVNWNDIIIVETVKDGNYTGRYNITRDGEMLNTFPLAMSQVFDYQLVK